MSADLLRTKNMNELKQTDAKQSNNKKLATNMFLFTLVNFVPKVFSFILVPVYTAYLSTEEYGISDLVINTASLLLPIFSLSINNAVLRFTIENKDDIRPYNIGMLHSFGSSALLALGLFLTTQFTDINVGYLFFIFVIYASNAISDIFLGYLRAQEEMYLITFCGVGSSIICLVSNILLIVVLRLGAYGFIISTAVGYLFNVVVILYHLRNKKVFDIHSIKCQKQLARDMYSYSIPLAVSGITWWIYSSSDRYFVSGMCGIEENGIYSVANKVPNMLQMLQNVFSQAWMFSIFSIYKTREGKEYIAKVYYMVSYVMCLGASVLITGNILLARVLYSKEFYAAWRYVPPLLLSITFTAIGTVMGQVLIAHKETKFQAKVALFTALLNCLLNFMLIKVTKDALGAAIATAIIALIGSSMTTWKGVKIGEIKINSIKYIVMIMILVAECCAMIGYKNSAICGLLTAVIAIINIDHNRWLINKFMTLLRKRLVRQKIR